MNELTAPTLTELCTEQSLAVSSCQPNFVVHSQLSEIWPLSATEAEVGLSEFADGRRGGPCQLVTNTNSSWPHCGCCYAVPSSDVNPSTPPGNSCTGCMKGQHVILLSLYIAEIQVQIFSHLFAHRTRFFTSANCPNVHVDTVVAYKISCSKIPLKG